MKLMNKVALVTGGGSGIGRKIAERLANEGAKVLIMGRTHTPLVETSQHQNIDYVVGDITCLEDISNTIAELKHRFGRLDILVNNAGRGKVFDEIADGTIAIEKIESSDFYKKIEQRIHFLPLLEQMIDSNDTVFKYNKKANMYSMIEADYLMENKMESRNLFLFLSNDDGDKYFCRSFFPEEKMDYSKNQASWTLLYKKKTDLITGIETVLYNKLK